MLANPSWGLSHAVTPHNKEMLKKYIHVKGAIDGQIQGLPVFYQSYSHHLVRWYALWNTLSCQLYFVNVAVFFPWGVVLDTEIWGLMIKKWTFRNFQDEMRISCNSVSNIHW